MTRPISPQFRVSLGFGVRYPLSWKYRWNSPLRFLAGKIHEGVDYACPKGTPVMAPIGMIVTAINRDERNSYGRYVRAKSLDGTVTLLFAHLDVIATATRAGKEWHEGEVFCWSGSTGPYTSGPHLHFEGRKNGILFDVGKWVTN
jgi:murein DD-endopeptidase MepM/ murein hydrolase activator NlpD